MHDWTSAVALVTGANGGLGRAFVDELLRLGARKVYAASRSVLLQPTDERIVPIILDVTSPSQVRAAASQARDVTLLINNAGMNLQSGVFSSDSTDAARREMEVNYFGILAMAQAFAPALIERQGTMINVLPSSRGLHLRPWRPCARRRRQRCV